MSAYAVFLVFHIAAGCVALLAFWSAALLRKGSPRHRAVGKVFLLAMCGILATGVVLAGQRFLDGRTFAGVFLSYLLVITAQAMWMSWRAVTDKRDWRAMVARPGWRVLSIAALGSGAGVMALGVVQGIPLFMGFSLVGLVAGTQMVRFARRGPSRPNWSVVQHYQGMLGCGIATHIAFLTIGLRPLWAWLKTYTVVPAALVELFPWFAPLVVAMVAAKWLDRKYGRPRSAVPGAGVAGSAPSRVLS